MLRRPLASIVALLLVVACDDPPPASDAGTDAGRDAGGSGQAPCAVDAGLDAGVAMGLTNVCTEGLVLSGFGLRFRDGAHPLSRFDVHASTAEHPPDGCPPSATLRGATLVASLGGDTIAPGTVSATYHAIGAGGGRTPPDAGGWSGLAMRRGAMIVDLDAESEASAPALFDLAAAGMSGAPAVVVILDGIDVETDVAQSLEYPTDWDPADGYTIRGLGAWVGEVARDGDDLRFDVGARFALGRSDVPAMNRALGVARVRATVHYAVVALPEAPATGSVAYHERHFGHGDVEDLEVCRPPASATALSIEGRGHEHAAPALTRFSLGLFVGDAPEGDRVRELSIRVGDFRWDAASRTATMHVEGYASNAGPAPLAPDAGPPPAPRPMDYAVEADVVLLEWDGTDPVESLRFDAPIEPGRNALPLPLTRL